MHFILKGNRFTVYGNGVELLERIRINMYYSDCRKRTYRENSFEPLIPKRVPVEFYGLRHNKRFSLPYERIDNFDKVTVQYVKEQANNKSFTMSYGGTGISYRYNCDGSWKISMLTTKDEADTSKEIISDLR